MTKSWIFPRKRMRINVIHIVPGGRFHIIRNLLFTLSLNKIDSAERILYSFDASTSTSMTKSWVTCSTIPVLGEIPFRQQVSELVDLTHLIWIMGSKIILSSYQSRATLWNLETCLNVGLLPFIIILITASLTSKMYNIVPFWQEFTFDETKSSLDNSRYPWETGVLIWEFNFLNAVLRDSIFRACLSFCFWFEFECMTSLNKSQRSCAGIPSILKSASREIISDSAELCDTHCDC